MNKEFFDRARYCFERWSEYKRPFDEKIISDSRWFYNQLKFDGGGDEARPSSSFLFNAIANKHADAMDNFPEACVLARTLEDEAEAKALSEIMPIQMELSGFKSVYSQNWWNKLKHGTAVYGVFFDGEKNGGIGEIKIKAVDILNIFYEPYIHDIQESEFVFCTEFISTQRLKKLYPGKRIPSYSDEGKVRKQLYRRFGEEESEKSLVVDCYYKTDAGVSLLKFCGDELLDSTEERGQDSLYAHGRYPFVFDVLYPGEEPLMGLSMIDVMKNPQEYINKLDDIISKNALMSGKVRYMVKDSGGINEYELTDLSSDIIHVAGSVDEANIRQLQPAPLDAFVINHRQSKIAEMKEISGNRDFQQGGTSGGVTSGTAITTLQQAGEKLSRDMISQSYECYKQLAYMCAELIREFYTEPHFYRICAADGSHRYITYAAGGRRCEFDIEIHVRKNNPYGKAEQNALVRELYAMGVFDRENAEKSLLLAELMQFDGKERVCEYLKNAIAAKGGEKADGQINA